MLILGYLIFYSVFGKNLGLFYYPLSFGLILGIVNLKFFNSKIFDKYGVTGVLLCSVMISLCVFTIGILSLGLHNFIDWIMPKSDGQLATLIFGNCIISPLLLIYFYGLILKIKFNKIAFVIIFTAITILSLSLTFYIEYLQIEQLNSFQKTLLNPYFLWQLVMMLLLQVLIHRAIKLEAISSKKN